MQRLCTWHEGRFYEYKLNRGLFCHRGSRTLYKQKAHLAQRPFGMYGLSGLLVYLANVCLYLGES